MDAWGWAWFVLAAILLVGEIVTAGFFLLPFGIGAIVAGIFAFFDLALGWQLVAFIIVSGVALFSLRRFSDRVTHEPPVKVGIDRLLGREGTVIDAIEGSRGGRVLIDREEWRADAADGMTIPEGAKIVVDRVVGTRVIVHAASDDKE